MKKKLTISFNQTADFKLKTELTVALLIIHVKSVALLRCFLLRSSFLCFLFCLRFFHSRLASFQDQDKASLQLKEYVSKLELENKENLKNVKAAQDQ